MNPNGNGLQLRDIHLPDAVSWWPPAPGWWLLAILIIVLLFVLPKLFNRWRRWRRRKPINRLALNELYDIRTRFAQHHDTQHLAQDLSILLRRTLITYLPRKQAAAVTGDAWIEQLNRLGEQALFDAAIAQQLLHAPYRKQMDVDGDALLDTCERWLQQLPKRSTP